MQDITDVGQEIEVKFLGHDRRGFIKLSRKACLPSQSEHADVPEAPGTPPSVSSPHKVWSLLMADTFTQKDHKDYNLSLIDARQVDKAVWLA